jgi:tetratricopeptide (TPR) repeat protein
MLPVLFACLWLVAACESQQDRAEKSRIHYKRGLRYTRTFNLEEAILELKYAIHLDPSFEKPYYQLGVTYQNIGTFESAIEYYRSFLKFNPDHLDAHIRLAQTYNLSGRNEEAISEAEYIINRVPIGSEIAIEMHNILGNIYLYKKKEFEPAIYHFKKVMDKRPEMVTPYISFAKYYLKNKKIDKTLEMIQKALSISPKNLAAHEILIELYREKEDWDNLVATYQNIIKYYPKLIDMQITLSELYLELKRYPEAMSEALAIYQKDPKDIRTHYILGEIAFQQGKYSEALNHFRLMMGSNYKSDRTSSRLGKIYKRMGRFKEAMEFYEKLIFTRPDIFEAQYYLTLLAFKTKNYFRAEKGAMVLKGRLYEFHEAYFYLGKARFYLGMIEDAINSLEKYQQFDYEAMKKTTKYAFYKMAYPNMLSPEEFRKKNQAHNQVESRYLLGLAYLMTDQNEKAVEELEKLVFTEPNLPFGFILAAIAHHRLGHYEEALKHCRLTEILVQVDKPLVNFVKANIYASQWDLEKAKLLLSRANGSLYSYNFSKVDITNYTSVTEPNSLADLSLAFMMMRNNWKKKTQQLCERVLHTNPKNSVANFILDNSYILFNEYYSQKSEIADQSDRITIPEVYE